MGDIQTLSYLNPETTALVLIDLQRGIISMPTEPFTANQVIKNAKRLMDAFHKIKAQIILVRVAGAPDVKDMFRPQADEPMMQKSELTKDWVNYSSGD